MTRLGATRGWIRAVLFAFALVMIPVAALTGCSTHSSSAATGSRINVTMHDFGITVSRHLVPAGKVVLHVTNIEFIEGGADASTS